jgi:4-aminobutyrate aminotransferase
MTTAVLETKLPVLKTALPGPEAKRMVELDAKFVSPSFTRDYPLVAKTGRGSLVEDVDGNVFLDLGAGVAVVSTGHCHPQVVAAIQKQAAELIHMCEADFYYPHLPEYAQKITSVVPIPGDKRVYFGNSGAEAVEAAIKLSRYHTRRDKIIAFYGCFHGRTLGALALTSSKAVQRKGMGPLMPGVFHIPFPNVYRRPAGMSVADYALECAAILECELFKRIVDPEEVAAIFVEPMQGEGGYLVAPPEFLKELERISKKYGILLVADEVQSGMGRTGKWWAFEHSGITPDIVLSAKGIASGMPLGVAVASSKIMNWGPGAHASTFGGNPVCLAAAEATFDLIKGKYLENALRMGEFFKTRLANWTQRFRNIGDVRGLGLMLGVEIVKDQKSKEPAKDLRDQIVDRAFHKGILLIACGQNCFRICPPLVIEEEQADFAVKTMEGIFTEIEKTHSV